MAKKMNNTSEK